jgi:hypothetical protein
MPPYPEKQSPLLVRLKQKKPLMEAEGVTEPSSSTTTAGHTDDGPKFAETAVKISKRILFEYFLLLFRFILINNNNNKMVFLYLLILQNPMVIMKNPHQIRFL